MARTRKIFVTAAVLIPALLACCKTAAQQFEVSATLQSGVTLNGRLPGESWSFDAISVSKQPVTITVRRPPEWSSSKSASEIDWVPGRGVYVIRDLAWTGELLRLWDKLTVLGPDGKTVVIPGSEVKRVRFLYASAGKPQPAW